MTVKTWTNGDLVNADDLDRWERGVAASLTREAHAPGLGAFFPEAEGAVGIDGTIDDSAAIQAALSASVVAGNKGVVLLRDGAVYGLGNRLTLPAGSTLAGRATLKMLAGATSQAILIQNVSDVRVTDLSIDMNKSATAGGSSSNAAWQGIYISATNQPMRNITVRGVSVANGWQRGIAAVSTNAANPICDLVIDRCAVSNVGDVGIFVSCIGNTDRITPSTSQRISILAPTVTGDGKGGVQLIGCSYATIDDPYLDGQGTSTGHGICFSTAGTTTHVTDFSCTKAKVKGYTGAGKWAIVVSNSCTRFSINGNPAITGNTGGITIDPEDAAAVGVLTDVAGVVFANTIRGSLGGAGISARTCKNLTVSGNTSIGNNGSGIGLSNCYGCSVIGNTSNGNAAFGVAISGTNTGTGGHTIGPNTTRDNVAGAVNTSATPIASAFATTQATP